MKLYKHQIEAINFAIKARFCCAFFHDPGLGKTLTALTCYRYLRKKQPGLRLLVVCPKSLINPAWREDTNRFTNLSYSYIRDKDTTTDIVSVNFETLISKKYLAEVTKMLRNEPFMIVVDESSRMKSFKTKITKTLLKLAELVQYRIILSGTPTPNSEVELWGQINFIRPYIMLRSFYQFRNTYFHLERNGKSATLQQGQRVTKEIMQEMFRTGWKYVISPLNRKKMLSSIQHLTHWKKKEDALDLPEKIDVIREIELSPEERKTYIQMKELQVAEIKENLIAAPVALSKFMKLRQITSGFAYSEGNTYQIGRSKFKELQQVLEELGRQKVLIWCQFKEEIRQIKELLGDKAVTMYSETTDKDDSVRQFRADKQYMIAHPKSAAHGLTLIEANTQIFYSMDYSYEAYQQARDRIHRIGQQKSCLYIHFVATMGNKPTIDKIILTAVRKKQTLQEVIRALMT